jgi:hypothetical protein
LQIALNLAQFNKGWSSSAMITEAIQRGVDMSIDSINEVVQKVPVLASPAFRLRESLVLQLRCTQTSFGSYKVAVLPEQSELRW